MIDIYCGYWFVVAARGPLRVIDFAPTPCCYGCASEAKTFDPASTFTATPD